MYLSNMNEQKINSHFSAYLCPNYYIIRHKVRSDPYESKLSILNYFVVTSPCQ